MYMNAYHKVQGEVRMFEVDARNAIARFPAEWSAEPWAEEGAESSLSTSPKIARPKKMEGAAPEESADNAGT